MSKLAGQITIIGEQQHTCSIAVETSYRIDTLRTNILHEVHDCLTLLWIIAGSNIILRLVQQHINLLFQRNRTAVELHNISTEHLGTQLLYYIAINSNSTCLDKVISLATTAYAGISQVFVQANRLIGINMLFLILDTFLQAIFCIGIIIGSTLTVATLRTLLVTATLLIAATRSTVATALRT